MSIDRFRLGLRVAAGAAGATMALGLGYGIAAADSDSPSPHDTNPAASSPSSPGADASPESSPKTSQLAALGTESTSSPAAASGKRARVTWSLPKSPLPKTRPLQRSIQSRPAIESSTTESDDESSSPTQPVSTLPHDSSPVKPKHSSAEAQPAAPLKRRLSAEQAETETAVPQVQQSGELSAGLPAETSTLAARTNQVATGSEPTSAAAALRTPLVTTVQAQPALAAPAADIPTFPLLRAIGTLFFSALVAVEKVVVGPPVVPPGSTVTVSQAPLEIGDITVTADWYTPAGPDPPTGIIYLQHGFFATAPMYSYTAATLAEQTHSIVVAPSLSSNFLAADGNWLGGTQLQRAAAALFVDDRAALTASASAAAGHPVTLPQKFVLVGHSLGGGFVTAMAGFNGASDDLAGVVLLDPVGLKNAIPIAMDTLSDDVPVLMISSPPYVWNMFGIASTELVAARPGDFVGVQLVGGRHIDAMQGGNPLIQLSAYLIAGISRPRNIEAVKVLEVGWIKDMFAGRRTHDDIYAEPGETIRIGTSAGTATAIALPTPPTLLSPITDLARVLFKLGSDVLFGLFDTEPSPSRGNDPGHAAWPMTPQFWYLPQLSAPNAA